MKNLNPSNCARSFVNFLNERNISGKVLDLGCGYGRDSLFFAKKGLKVTAIDISSKSIKEAKKLSTERNLKICFDIGNIENLPYKNSSFSAVYSVCSLHFTDLNESIKEVYRVLKIKGIAFLHIFEKIEYLKTKKIKFFYSEKDVLNCLNNFRIINKKKSESFDINYNLKDHKHYNMLFIVEKL
jgi:ubiquinone/menaquinone biosynthesis C-methylase UbiE